jgi:hypothetical protein
MNGLFGLSQRITLVEVEIMDVVVCTFASSRGLMRIRGCSGVKVGPTGFLEMMEPASLVWVVSRLWLG